MLGHKKATCSHASHLGQQRILVINYNCLLLDLHMPHLTTLWLSRIRNISWRNCVPSPEGWSYQEPFLIHMNYLLIPWTLGVLRDSPSVSISSFMWRDTWLLDLPQVIWLKGGLSWVCSGSWVLFRVLAVRQDFSPHFIPVMGESWTEYQK